MIHIDNLDGEGTIFMSTDDGTQSIGHVEKEYASILQDVLESYDWYVEEVKRLQTIMYEIEAHNGVSAEVIAASSDALFMNELLAEVKRLRRMADELIAIWEILEEDYPHVDRAIVKELIERKIGDYEVIE